MALLVPLLGAAALSAAATTSACFVTWEEGHLVIEADRPVRVTQFRLKEPERRILDLHGTDLADAHTPSRITVGGGGVQQVRIARHPDKRMVRVVLDLDAHAELTLQTFDGGRRLLAWPDSGVPAGPPTPWSAEAFIGPPAKQASGLAAGPLGPMEQAGGQAGRHLGQREQAAGPSAGQAQGHAHAPGPGQSSGHVPGIVPGGKHARMAGNASARWTGRATGDTARRAAAVSDTLAAYPGARDLLVGPPAPGSPETRVGPPGRLQAVADSRTLAPGSRVAAGGNSSRSFASEERRLAPARHPHIPAALVAGKPGALATIAPTPAPDEVVSEASGSRAVPWPTAPQVVESIRLRRSGRETTLEIRARGPLMAWVQDEWQARRVTVRVPRSSVACAVPRPAGVVSGLILRREEESWALALDLEDGPLAFDSAPIDGGKGLRIRMRPAPALKPDRPLVLIDPGHGGYDPGAIGTGGTSESQVALEIAKRAAKALADLGIQSVLTRTMDAEVRLPDRVALIERYDPAAFISLHCNSSEAPEATGVETYYRHETGLKLSRTIHERLVAATGSPDRGVRSGRLYVLRGERIPATLVEMGFISSREDEARLTDPAYQKRVARAIAEGVKGYLDGEAARSATEGALALGGNRGN